MVCTVLQTYLSLIETNTDDYVHNEYKIRMKDDNDDNNDNSNNSNNSDSIWYENCLLHYREFIPYIQNNCDYSPDN